MNKNRFRFDRAKKDITCYNCHKHIGLGQEFAWDNEPSRNGVKLCESCVKLLSDVLEDTASAEKSAAAASLIKSAEERIQILEEQVTSLSQQVLHLKSLYYNEIRTYTRSSAEAANRRLSPLPSNPTPESFEGFKTPAGILNAESYLDLKPLDPDEVSSLADKMRRSESYLKLDAEDPPF